MTLVDGSTLDAQITGTVAKVDLPQTGYNVSQSFRMTGKFIEGVGDTTRKVVLHVYYDGDDNPDFVVSAKHAKVAMYYDLANVTLTRGLNEITLLLTSKDWTKLGNIQYLAMYLGHKEGEPARTLWLIDSVIYNK